LHYNPTSTTIIMLFSTFLFVNAASATCLHGLDMFKKRSESAEGEVKVGTFGYGPLNGPFNWATLAVENEACKAGANQSPINLGTSHKPRPHLHIAILTIPSDASVSVLTEKPKMTIPEQEVEFENLGTTIEIIVNGTTSIGGTDFQLKQFHMHTPSEHHINGEYHPLEVHMVHQGVADNTKLAVIALMFQVSASNSSSIIRSLSSSLSAISAPGTKTAIPAGIDFSDVLAKMASSDILSYAGSLTTPPCAEGVSFMIVKDPLDISVADFNAIKSIVKFNSRYIQNNLGGVNMLEVASLAGTASAMKPVPVAVVEEKKSNGTKVDAAAAQMTPGHRFTVTEIEGMPTAIAAVVVARQKKW
jgi:carbonic anhydrase